MAAQEYFVATNGNDSWTGTRPTPNAGNTDGPFRTLTAARDAMRTSSIKRCYVRGGTYRVTSTLLMSSLDNGTAYYNYPGEVPVFYGSATQTTNSVLGGGLFGITFVTPPGLDVFCSGVRMNPACFFTQDPSDYTVGWGWARQDGTTTVIYTGASEVPALASLQGVWSQGFDRERLSDGLSQVTSITDAAPYKAITVSPAMQYIVRKGGTFRLFGHHSWIANANEFGWNPTTNQLVVRPTDPNNYQIAIPVMNEFISATGVTGLVIRGLDFRENTRDAPALRFSGCTNVWVQDCWFYRVGEACHFSGGATCLVERCSINDVCANGVYADTHCNALTVRGNVVQNVGTHLVGRKNGTGIGGNGMDNCVIKWNSITGCARYGISIKDWNADNANTFNTVQFNTISDAMKHGADGAAIEMLGRSDNQTGNSVLDNFIDGAPGVGSHWNGTTDLPEWLTWYKGWGVYLDDKTNDVLVQGNFVANTGWGGYFVHGGDNNELYNNIAVLSTEWAVAFRIEWMGSGGGVSGEPANNTIQRNIVYRTGFSGTPNYWTLFTPGTYTMGNNLVYGVAAKDATDTVADPLFVSPGTGNYRLQAGSPAASESITQLLFDDMGTQGYPTGTYYSAPPGVAYIEPVSASSARVAPTVVQSAQGLAMPMPQTQEPPPPPPVYIYRTGPGVYDMEDAQNTATRVPKPNV